MVFTPPGATAVEVPLRVVRSQAGAASLRVQVLDASTGQGIAGATVSVARDGLPDGRRLLTGASGTVALDGLGAGRYWVRAEAPGFRAAQQGVELAPAGRGGRGGTDVGARTVTLALQPAPAVDVDVQLQTSGSGPAEAGDLVRVEVSVALAPAAPAARAGTVELLLPDGLQALPIAAEEAAVRVQQDGRQVRWAIGPLQPGQRHSRTLLASVIPLPGRVGRALVRAAVRLELEGDGQAAAGSMVTATGQAELPLRQESWATSGVVLGRVVGPDGKGLEGAVVQTQDGRRTTAGPGGWFSLALAPGPHLLQVLGEGSDGLGPVAALVYVRSQGVHGVVLTLSRGAQALTRLAAAGQLEWTAAGPPQVGGGLSVEAPILGSSTSVAVRVDGSGVSVSRAELRAGAYRFTVSADPLDVVARLKALSPPSWPRSVGEEVQPPLPPQTSSGPVVLVSWSAPPGSGAAVARLGDPQGQGPEAPLLWAAVWRASQRRAAWWAGRLYADKSSDGGERMRWEAGARRREGYSGYRLRLAADSLPVALFSPDAGAVEVEAWGPAEGDADGADLAAIRLRHASGRKALSLLAASGDDLDELTLAVAGDWPSAADAEEEQTELILSPTLHVSWGLRRWSRTAQAPARADKPSVADAYAQFTFTPGPPEPEPIHPGAASAAPGSPPEALLRFRLGLVSVHGRTSAEQSVGAPGAGHGWRPYGGMAAVWPAVPLWSAWRAALGLSAVLVAGGERPVGDRSSDGWTAARSDDWAGRTFVWAETSGQPAPGVDLRLRLSWEGAAGPMPQQARPDGLAVRAQLTPIRPLTLSVGARAASGDLRWEEMALTVRRPPVYLQARADADDMAFALHLQPEAGAWKVGLQAQGARQAGSPWSLTTEAVYLTPRWTAALQARGEPGRITAELLWSSVRGGDAPAGDGTVEAGWARGSGLAPSARVGWRRVEAFGTFLDTVVVQPVVVLPLRGPWAVMADGLLAAQSGPGSPTRLHGWTAVGLSYTLPAALTGVRVEAGYRVRVAGGGGNFPGEGWFLRVGGWAGWMEASGRPGQLVGGLPHAPV